MTEREYQEYKKRIQQSRRQFHQSKGKSNNSVNLSQLFFLGLIVFSVMLSLNSQKQNSIALDHNNQSNNNTITQNNKVDLDSTQVSTNNTLKTNSTVLKINNVKQTSSFEEEDYFSKKDAQGIFIILSVEVTNTSQTTNNLEYYNLYLKDDLGRQYKIEPVSPRKIVGINEENFSYMYDNILPGKTNKVFLIYYVNTDAKNFSLEYKNH